MSRLEIKKTPKDEYLKVIEHSQLISVDLILRYYDLEENCYKYFLGKRKNNPAKNYWFVPGSRIYKNMLIKEGVKFVCKEEYGFDLTIENLHFLGVFEHIYNNNFDNENFGTHYVDFAYFMDIEYDNLHMLDMEKLYEQHSEIGWFSREEIFKLQNVHKYTMNYFNYKKHNEVVEQLFYLE